MSNEVAGKNAGNEKKKSTAKIPFIKSMKFRILLCVFISALIVGGVMMAVILPGISSELKSVNKNYVYDLAESVGEELDLLVESSGVDTTKNELACKLLSKESPVYMLLYDYTYERQCQQKAMKELECAATKLYHGDNEVSMHNILQTIQNK